MESTRGPGAATWARAGGIFAQDISYDDAGKTERRGLEEVRPGAAGDFFIYAAYSRHTEHMQTQAIRRCCDGLGCAGSGPNEGLEGLWPPRCLISAFWWGRGHSHGRRPGLAARPRGAHDSQIASHDGFARLRIAGALPAGRPRRLISSWHPATQPMAGVVLLDRGPARGLTPGRFSPLMQPALASPTRASHAKPSQNSCLSTSLCPPPALHHTPKTTKSQHSSGTSHLSHPSYIFVETMPQAIAEL